MKSQLSRVVRVEINRSLEVHRCLESQLLRAVRVEMKSTAEGVQDAFVTALASYANRTLIPIIPKRLTTHIKQYSQSQTIA